MSHWYTAAGEPMHQVPYADKKRQGEYRDTTIKDARKLKLWPSVTTINKVLAKSDFLEEWIISQALLAAAVHPNGWPRFQCEVLDEKHPDFVQWAKECKRDARLQVQVKADRGSILHDAMMRAHHAYDSVEPQYLAHVDGMLATLERTFGPRTWIAEGTFCSELGFGGSIDLRTVPDDPDPIIADYKFKDFDESKEASYFVYDEHKMQLGGYSIGVTTPCGLVPCRDYTKARLFNLFGSISRPGLCLVHEHTAADADYGRDLFLATLKVWQIKNGLAP